MSQRFKFNILTGENAADKYAAIPVKDPYTFYLLETGTGYLGTKKLFDNVNAVNTVDTINPDNPSNDIPTEAAIVNYVIEAVRNKVPYEIDGVPGEGSGSSSNSVGDIYSTEETRFGTLNGVPFYRKLIQNLKFNFSELQAKVVVQEQSTTNILKMSPYIVADDTGLVVTSNIYVSENQYLNIYLSNPYTICIDARLPDNMGKTCTVGFTIEYIKTTEANNT